MVLKGLFQGDQNMILALQMEPKLSKIEVQERSSSKQVLGRFKRPSRIFFIKKVFPFWGPFRVQNETQKQGVLSEVFWAAFGSK